MSFFETLLNADRRYIYLFVGLACLVPIFFPLGLPIGSSEAVRGLFERVESLEPGEVVMVSFDYGPSTGPENDPMAHAIARHCLRKDVSCAVS